MALGEEIARLAVALSMDTSDFATGSTKVQRDLGRLQGSFKALGDKWMQTGKRLTIGVSAPITAFGLFSAKVASEAQELDSAFSQTFGNLSDEMRNWARETGDAMGRSTQAMQEMANTFGIFFNQAAPTRKEAAEMSKTFAVLAQDLSSFYNVDGDVALQKLRSGLSGESEPLRDFGVFLTEATVKAKAMEMGLTGLGDELTEQEKIMARYALILEGTQNAQGDVARTSGGAANQWRSFTEALRELQVVIGEKLLPLLTPLVNGMTKIVNGFNNLPSGVQTAIVVIGGLVAAIGPLMLIMGTLAVSLLPLFLTKFGLIGTVVSALINPLGTAIALFGKLALSFASMAALKGLGVMLLRFAGPIGLIASAGLLIYQNWDRIAPMLREFWEAAKKAIGEPLRELIEAVRGPAMELWQGPFGEGIRMAMGVLGELAEVGKSVLGHVFIALLKGLLDGVLTVFETIGNVIRVFARVLEGDFQGAAVAAFAVVDTLLFGLPGKFANMVAAIKTLGGRFASMMVQMGRDMVEGLVRGIRETPGAVRDAVVGIASDAVQGAKDLLGIRSPSVVFMQIGRYIAEGLAIGIGSGADKVGAAVNAITPRMLDLGDGLDDFAKAANDNAAKTETATVRIAESFKDMADKTMRSFRSLTDAIRGGGFLDILEAGVGLFLQLGGTGLFGKGLAANINKTPGYATGTSFHPGGLAIVGERGPELVSMPRGSQVFTNRESMEMVGGGKLQVEVVANNNGFGAVVRNHAGQVVAEAAPSLMNGGAALAGQQASFNRSRRLA